VFPYTGSPHTFPNFVHVCSIYTHVYVRVCVRARLYIRVYIECPTEHLSNSRRPFTGLSEQFYNSMCHKASCYVRNVSCGTSSVLNCSLFAMTCCIGYMQASSSESSTFSCYSAWDERRHLCAVRCHIMSAICPDTPTTWCRNQAVPSLMKEEAVYFYVHDQFNNFPNA
jgi:hypothetical protein